MFDQGKYIFEIGASSKDIKGSVEASMSGAYTACIENCCCRMWQGGDETRQYSSDKCDSSNVGRQLL